MKSSMCRLYGAGDLRLETVDAYWIANECKKAFENAEETTFYSLLPLRFDNLGYYNQPEKYNYLELSTKSCFEYPYDLFQTFEIYKCQYQFALSVWKKAAEMIKEEYPGIESITFGCQQESGVYPINFVYNTEEIKNRQIEIIKELIQDGFSIDETLTLTYEENGNQKAWYYKGTIGPSYERCKKTLSDTMAKGKLIKVKKNVSYTYEECEKYYLSFDEKILKLGNQIRVYYNTQEENKPLFDAIKEKNIEKIKEYIKNGYSLNVIDIYGNSAFTNILYSLFDDEGKKEWDDIDTEETELLDDLFDTGVNPAIYGVNANECSLDEAVVCHRNKTAKWLLEKGVNPVFFPYIDDMSDEGLTLIDWLESILYEETRDMPKEKHDDVKEMLQMLKEYS